MPTTTVAADMTTACRSADQSRPRPTARASVGLGEADDGGADSVVDERGDEDAHHGGGQSVDGGLLVGGDVQAERGEELDGDSYEAQPRCRFTPEYTDGGHSVS
jgi:hypothetical protein